MVRHGAVLLFLLCGAAAAQTSVAEIAAKIKSLRQVPDEKRGAVTRQLAADIRALPATAPERNGLAQSLANLSTEGDFGKDTLQEVASTLGETLKGNTDIREFRSLASLVRYEHVRAPYASKELDAATAALEAEDRRREKVDFTLKDLNGKLWTMSALRGKVVLVNFWATWCPPCRKEMPDIDALYRQFSRKGLVVLAISDEEESKVRPFIAQGGYRYPILLDPGRRVHEAFAVEGIPKTFIFSREGKLAAQSIDMRTRGQFLKLLAQAGLE